MMNLLKKYKNTLFWFGIALLASIIVPRASAVTALTTATTTNSTEISQLNVLQAIVLGFVQGATEFIPISSTAHLKAIPVFFGWGDPGVAFTAVIQLGSIAAVLWYFWADLSQISQGMFKAIAKSNYDSQDFWLAVGILIGTIPIVTFGLAIKALIPDFDNSVLRSLTAIAIASIIMGLLLGAAEYFGSQRRSFNDLTVKDGIIIGLAQALALIPGVSRSGSTMTAGLFYNLDRATAARFSFLLGIPAITAAGLVELKGIIETGIDSSQTLAIVAGLISSAIFSYLAIAWLIKFLQKRSTWVFVWYRLGFGIFILAAIALGKI
jgi:undecaprenyl-diphosphatase